MPTNIIKGYSVKTEPNPTIGSLESGKIFQILSGGYASQEDLFIYTDAGTSIRLNDGEEISCDDDDLVEIIPKGTKLTITVG